MFAMRGRNGKWFCAMCGNGDREGKKFTCGEGTIMKTIYRAMLYFIGMARQAKSFLKRPETAAIFHCHSAVFHCHSAAFHCHSVVFHCHRAVFHCHSVLFHCHSAVFHCHRAVFHCHRAVFHCHRAV